MRSEKLFFYAVFVLAVAIMVLLVVGGIVEGAPWPAIVLLVVAYAVIAWLCLKVTRR